MPAPQRPTSQTGSKDMASVHKLFRAPKKHVPMEELQEARILSGIGLEGCRHAHRGGDRQILLVDRETLDAMELPPGILRENITSDGLNVNSLEMGRHLRIGQALLEVALVCTPCNQMERIRPGLRKELWERLANPEVPAHLQAVHV